MLLWIFTTSYVVNHHEILQDLLVALEPLMFESVLCRGSHFGVGLKHPVKKIPTVTTDTSDVLPDMTEIASNVKDKQLIYIVGVEEVLACNQVIEDTAKRENVDLVAVPLSLEDFWRNIPRRAAFEVEFLIIRYALSEAHISDADVIVFIVFNLVDQDVF